MKFKSQVFTQVSGSVGGLTYSRNRGGMYTRARAMPVDPGSYFQIWVRNQMAILTSRWAETLTDAQRAAWETYAENVLLPDTFGDPRNVGGLAHYVRSNLARRQAGEPRQDTAPIIFDLGSYTAVTDVEFVPSTTKCEFTITPADDWANEDDAAMILFCSRPQNPGVNFFKGPYRFAAGIQGDSVTPPSASQSLTAPFPFSVGQRVFGRVQVSRADGRYSSTQRFTAIAAES